MRISNWIKVMAVSAALGLGLLACGDEKSGTSWTGELSTVAELFGQTAELENTDFVALVDGVISFDSTTNCPGGGYYLRDSVGAKEALYLMDFYPDTNVFPARPDTFINVRVQGIYEPAEEICDMMLCHCQRNLDTVKVEKR